MSKTNIYINTIFRYCNDIDAMRHFYTDLLALDETYYRNDEEHGWLTYQIGHTQLVFTRASSSLAIEMEWAKSPAYSGGTKEMQSWVVALTGDNYQATIERIKSSDAPIYEGEINTPELLLLAQDPMGMTIEFWLEAEDN